MGSGVDGDKLGTIELLRIMTEGQQIMNEDMKTTAKQLQEIATQVSQYNYLQGMINDLALNAKELSSRIGEVATLQLSCSLKEDTRYSMSDRLRNWGVWAVALSSLIINIILAIRLFMRG